MKISEFFKKMFLDIFKIFNLSKREKLYRSNRYKTYKEQLKYNDEF